MIQIQNLVKRFGSKYAVDDISFFIDEGEIVGFLGPNGAGKSTTMNIITGYMSSTSGTASIGGIDILENPTEAKRLIGYLPEQPPLYTDMTVKEYLNFVYELKGCKLNRKKHLEEICEVVKISDDYKKGRIIKNLSKEDSVTVNRKVQEIFRALAVEKRYTKEEIMEWYLNTIYLGQGCYGVQSAAQVYFGKDVSELSTAECACIVGITNNPSLYDPYYFPNNNRKRQTTILEEMYKQGYIQTEADLAAAEGEEMLFHNGRYDEKEYTCGSCGFTGPRSAYVHEENAYLCPECGVQNFSVDDSEGYSYFVDTVYRDVVEDFQEAFDLSAQAAERKLLTGGYRIYATINPDIQNLVDRVYGDVNNVPGTVSAQQMQSAIAIVDNATGDLIAIRGGVGEKNGSLTYNRAEAALPTGSAIKPVSVYAPALDAGVVTPATSLSDSPLFDKSKMATFERYFVENKATHREEKGWYYRLRDNAEVCDSLMNAFGVKGKHRHIINGHVPVRASKGEKPIKAEGRLMVIDGGFAKAYHDTTGIAGYTLVYHSRGFQLVQHAPFTSTEEAILNGTDIQSTTQIVEMMGHRAMVNDTDKGAELREQIADLEKLLVAYRRGFIKE